MDAWGGQVTGTKIILIQVNGLILPKILNMSDWDDITGIILAGGKSSRMGRDKGLCLLGGKPMISYAVRVLEPFSRSLVVGANEDAYEQLGYPVIRDLFPGIGPIGGIYSCLSACRTKGAFVLSCDMPLLGGDLIAHILAHREGVQAVVPCFRGRPEPLCAYYRQDASRVFLQSIENGNYKLQDVIGKLKTRHLDIDPALPFYREDLFTNLNSEVDLAMAELRLREERSDG